MGALTTNNAWKNNESLRQVDFAGGDKLLDLVIREGYSQVEINNMTAVINGEVERRWHDYEMNSTDNVAVLMLPAGHGGGAKKAVTAIAGIALTVASMGVGAVVAASYGVIAGGVASVAVSMAGSLVMGAIAKHMIKTPAQHNSTAAQADPFLDIAPSSNVAQQYGVVPTVLGRMRIYPRLIAQPEITTVGDHREIIQAFDFGFGELVLQDEQFGDLNLSSANSVIKNIKHQPFGPGDDLQLAYKDIRGIQISNGELKDTNDLAAFSTPQLTKEVLVEIAFPSGLIKYNDNGDKTGTSLQAKVQVRKVGGTGWFDAFDVNDLVSDYRKNSTKEVNVTSNSSLLLIGGKVQGGVRAGFNIRFKDPGEYEFHITRLSPDHTADNEMNQGVVDFARATLETGSKIIDLIGGVEHTVVELQVKGTQSVNGTLDNYSAIATSKVWVWDGHDWTKKASRNPAWLYLHCLICGQNRKRLDVKDAHGKPVTSKVMKKVDLNELKEWADWCDDSTHIKPFTCDLLVSGSTTLKELLTTIASCGLATPTMADGRISIVWEAKLRQPVQVITPYNASNISARMSYSKRINGVKVRFRNEEIGYDQDEIIVNRDFDLVDSNNLPDRLQDYDSIDLPGTTNVTQATILGRFYMSQEILRREEVTFNMDIENLVLNRGDVLALWTDVLKDVGVSSRIDSIDTQVGSSAITLNMHDDIPPTNSTNIQLRNGKILPIKTVDKNSIIVDSSLHNFEVGELLIVGTADIEKSNYIVTDIRAGKDLSASITAMEYGNGSIYRSTISGHAIPDREKKPGYDVNGKIAAPALSSFVDDLVIARKRNYRITLIWTNSHAVVHHYIITDEAGNVIGTTEETTFQLQDVPDTSLAGDETRKYTVTPVSVTGILGGSASTQVTLHKDRTKPFDVTEFSANVQDQSTHLTWRAVDQDDVSGYEIRYSNQIGGAIWENSVRVVDYLPFDSTDAVVPSRIGTYFIKAFDSSGNYSNKANETYTQIGTLDYNVLKQVISPAPASGGKWVNVAGSTNIQTANGGNTIQLTKGARYGVYQHMEGSDDFIDLGQVEKIHLSSDVSMNVTIPGEELDSAWFNPLAHATPISPALAQTPNIADAQVYYSVSKDGTNYSDYTRLFATDSEFRYIKMQVRLYSRDGSATPTVANATIQLDFIKRYEHGNDLVIPAAGKPVTFTNAYATTPSIALTLQSGTGGDTAKITNASATGFTIHIFDKDGTEVGSRNNGKVDWTAIGHGKII
ncbi:hypothetical protein [Vibrio breoganii]|uniref:TipJ family phage tail tip protein n=1 Tax=Vibrio breoganii TaxID=553239 RepID=UPI000C830993|nr:hypothetical protein [Vibrio breoganii]PMK30671.1 hypothetical protein BCU03_09655 [Vibrio breoganii]